MQKKKREIKSLIEIKAKKNIERGEVRRKENTELKIKKKKKKEKESNIPSGAVKLPLPDNTVLPLPPPVLDDKNWDEDDGNNVKAPLGPKVLPPLPNEKKSLNLDSDDDFSDDKAGPITPITNIPPPISKNSAKSLLEDDDSDIVESNPELPLPIPKKKSFGGIALPGLIAPIRSAKEDWDKSGEDSDVAPQVTKVDKIEKSSLLDESNEDKDFGGTDNTKHQNNPNETTKKKIIGVALPGMIVPKSDKTVSSETPSVKETPPPTSSTKKKHLSILSDSESDDLPTPAKISNEKKVGINLSDDEENQKDKEEVSKTTIKDEKVLSDDEDNLFKNDRPENKKEITKDKEEESDDDLFQNDHPENKKVKEESDDDLFKNDRSENKKKIKKKYLPRMKRYLRK